MLVSHACFLIKYGTHREESVRELADKLLIQLKEKFPQVGVFPMKILIKIPLNLESVFSF